jgi:hypothetical protein
MLLCLAKKERKEKNKEESVKEQRGEKNLRRFYGCGCKFMDHQEEKWWMWRKESEK